ncbi:MAG: bifunctional oligoribonuclease/PAP phosphatase NrnA [Bacilli bacterium]|nr:bifunctional oligoribonuclease/PAP phosphatase NrnA [Bacilli bacterium]
MYSIYKKIYKKIRKYDTIVIARHIGPDPDALASELALKEIILETFPNKKVYAVGCPTAKFRYLGTLDKIDDTEITEALLIVTDTPDRRRVDNVDFSLFKESIKIDHHPFIEKFCDLEYIDETASSASQMIMEIVYHTKLKMTKSAAEKLYIGLTADTGRFLFNYTTPRTFDLVSKLIKETKIDFTNLYTNLYIRPLKEIKFLSYIYSNINVTENGFGYLKITDDILTEYNVDPATAGNMVNELNYINEIIAWGLFSVDKVNNNIRGTLRSRGPIVNEIATNYGGGGHTMASGVKLENFEMVDNLINDLDLICKNYKEENE